MLFQFNYEQPSQILLLLPRSSELQTQCFLKAESLVAGLSSGTWMLYFSQLPVFIAAAQLTQDEVSSFVSAFTL